MGGSATVTVPAGHSLVDHVELDGMVALLRRMAGGLQLPSSWSGERQRRRDMAIRLHLEVLADRLERIKVQRHSHGDTRYQRPPGG